MFLKVVAHAWQGAAMNMAIDAALLEHEGAWLRFYGWQPSALSLGHFQRFADFADYEGRIPFVRRPTGGGAILHDREITFSLVVPQKLFPHRIRAAYDLVNAAVRSAVRLLGLELFSPARREVSPDPQKKLWCFANPTGLDLVRADGRKVFGSAQRRLKERTLHHGSLVLERHPWTPFTGALRPGTDAAELRHLLETELARGLGCSIEKCVAVPANVQACAKEIAERRFARASWTRIR